MKLEETRRGGSGMSRWCDKAVNPGVSRSVTGFGGGTCRWQRDA